MKSGGRQGALFGPLVGILGSAILFRALLGLDSSRILWADNFDARLVLWIVEWGYHILFQKFDPLNFWNANSFFPYQHALAFSDSLMSAQLLYGPLRLLGVAPTVALYLTLIAFCILGCTLTDLALRKIGGFSIYERVLILFSAHFSLCVVDYAGHYQLFGFQLAPACLLFLYLYLERWALTTLIWLCSIFSLCTLFSAYAAPMLFSVGIIAAIPRLKSEISNIGLRGVASRISWRGFLVIALTVVILYVLQFRFYLNLSKGWTRMQPAELMAYSANFSTLFTGFSGSSLWYSSWGSAPAESAYFPGIFLLCSGGFSLLWYLSNFSRSAQLTNFVLLVFVAALVLSWGPQISGHPEVKLPFYWMSHVVPGLSRVRAPGRFGILLGLPLGFFAAILLRRLFDSTSKSRVYWTVAICLLILDSITVRSTHRLWLFDPTAYSKVADLIPVESPILELPVAGTNDLHTILRVGHQLNGSMLHWRRLIVGHGAKYTQEHQDLVTHDRLLQSRIKREDLNSLLEFAKSMGVRHVLLHKRYSKRVLRLWLEVLRDPGRVKILYTGKGYVLFELI